MNIVILSGKGGTGKTTISTNLALLLGANYIDCDVEEPNGFIFLQPDKIEAQDVEVDRPIIDRERCSLCGKCVHTCQFNALAKGRERIILFKELCHSCGACGLVCSEEAIDFKKRTIGVTEEGWKDRMLLRRGILNIGEPIAVPVLNQLLEDLPQEGVNLLDAPPGTSCNVVAILRHGDYAILVTEPTAFGLHDLKMAVQLARRIDIPFGLIINKYDQANDYLDAYIREENINLLGVIPYSRQIAESYSRGETLLDLPEGKAAFASIKEKMEGVVL